MTEEEAGMAIENLKADLIRKKEAGNLFGGENAPGKLKGILGSINQTFGGNDLYPTIEEKAAHLLYFIIKDHPFIDGKNRIGSLLFIWFLDRNRYLYGAKGERKINDNALVALALLVAESNPKHKEVMIKLVINLIAGNQ
jgi:prophage maintenance system killer protein